jgi:hypothetical protein
MEIKTEKIIKTIRSRTPVRINDIGGWTDTWFLKDVYDSFRGPWILEEINSLGKGIQSIPISLNLRGVEVFIQR